MPKVNPVVLKPPAVAPLERKDALFDLTNPKASEAYYRIKMMTGEDSRENILLLRRDIKDKTAK